MHSIDSFVFRTKSTYTAQEYTLKCFPAQHPSYLYVRAAQASEERFSEHSEVVVLLSVLSGVPVRGHCV